MNMLVCKLAPVHGGQRETFRLAGDRQVLISKGINLLTRLFLGSCKKSWSPHLPFWDLKSLCRDLNWVQACIPSRRSQHLTLSRLYPWNSFHCGTSGWNIHSKDSGSGQGASSCLGPALGSTRGYVLLITSSNKMIALSISNLYFSCKK